MSELRSLLYQDVRDAVAARLRKMPMVAKIGFCSSYCKAYKCYLDKEYCTAVINSMEPEPDGPIEGQYRRFLPTGWVMNPKLASADTFHDDTVLDEPYQPLTPMLPPDSKS